MLPVLMINNKNIKRTDTFKFLGVTFDSHLSWKNHISNICNKISKINGILSILKYYLPTHILVMIYNSLILSHLNYNITIWGFGNLYRLKILQKNALRHISKSSFNAHSKPIAKNLKTLLIDDIFSNMSLFKFYYKYTQNITIIFL
jgi:hypothetical protein